MKRTCVIVKFYVMSILPILFILSGLAIANCPSCPQCYKKTKDSYGNCGCADKCGQNQGCCNGQCYDYATQGCCNGQVYNFATQECCNNQVKNKGNCMACVDGSWISICITKDCETCQNDRCVVCNDTPTKCCVEGECKDHCGLTCPCREDQYCCGSSIPLPGLGECCNQNQECCYTEESGFFCNLPCEFTNIDCTSCAESQEENYKCMGCTYGLAGYQCQDLTYRDYTGLEIKGCEYGCSHNMGYEPCYYVKECQGTDYDDKTCVLCGNGEYDCIDCTPEPVPPPGEGCQCTISGEVVNVSCNIAEYCNKCSTGGTVVDMYPRYTCIDCSDS